MSRTERAVQQFDRLTVAAVQASPVFLDLEATLAKVLQRIIEAASLGAHLIVFPEAFLAGYPYWLWGNAASIEQEAFVDLWESAIDVPGPETDVLGAAARDADAVVMIGVIERESTYGRGTLFNTLLVPLIAGIVGLLVSFRMTRLPDIKPSAALEGLLGG